MLNKINTIYIVVGDQRMEGCSFLIDWTCVAERAETKGRESALQELADYQDRDCDQVK